MNDAGADRSAHRVAGIVVAAGAGERLRAHVPKAFVPVGEQTLLARAVAAMRAGGIDELVVVAPGGWLDRTRKEVGGHVVVVEGGATRTASVAAGLAALDVDVDVVAVHDAARPFVPSDVVAAAVAAVVDAFPRTVLAAAPGRRVADTVKQVEDATVVATVDRSHLVAIQTPQVFRRDVLVAAHADADAAGEAATDDLALVERLVAAGELTGRVVVTPGSALAFKVTRPEDLTVALALAASLDGHRGPDHDHADPGRAVRDHAGS